VRRRAAVTSCDDETICAAGHSVLRGSLWTEFDEERWRIEHMDCEPPVQSYNIEEMEESRR